MRCGDVIMEAQAGFASGERANNGIVQLRMNNINTSGQFIFDSYLRVPATDEQINKYKLSYGDVLFNNTNSTDLVGKSAVFLGYEEPIVYSNHFTRIKCKDEVVSNFYFAWWLLFQWKIRTFANICNIWIGQSAVPRDKLFEMELPLPPLPEQKRIAEKLNACMAEVEKARKAAQEQLAAAQSAKIKIISSVFSESNVLRWAVNPLGEIAEVVSGVTLGRKLKHGRCRAVPYLRVANVKDGYIDLSDIKHTPATEDEIERLSLKSGDLLLTEGGDHDKLGRGSYWKADIPECIHQNHIFRIRFSADYVMPEFASLQFCSHYGKNYFLSHAKQTTGIATINKKVVNAFPMLVPLLDEQRNIVSAYNTCSNNVIKIESYVMGQLEDIRAIPSALLKQAFNGEL